MPMSREDVEAAVIQEAAALTSAEIDASSSLLEFGIDSFASATFAKKLSGRFGVQVAVRDLFQYSTVQKLAKHLHTQISVEPPPLPSAEMQLLQNMKPLTGLRGMIVMEVFWWHFHGGFPAKYWAAFGRCVDMEVLFCVMGLTMAIQYRDKSFDSPKEIGWFLWSQWWKIFPMYWLCIAVVISAQYWNIYDETMFDEDHPAEFEFRYTFLSMMALQTTTTNMTCQFWLGIFWFVGTMWVIFLMFPILHTLSKRVAPFNDRFIILISGFAVTAVYFWLWLGCNADNGLFAKDKRNRIFLYSTPWVKVWIFASGMAVGRLLVASVKAQDNTGYTEQRFLDRISPKGWGLITDISGFILGFLTFGPPYYSRDWPHGPSQYGYYEDIETSFIFPMQLVFTCIFLYALVHNRGCIATVLNYEPVEEFGKVVFPFYLIHYPLTLFSLSNGTDGLSLVYNSDDWKVLNYDKSFRALYMYNGGYAFDVNHENGGSVYPFGALALTFVAAYFIIEYYQTGVMKYVEPFCKKLCMPCARCVEPCLNSIWGWFHRCFHGDNEEPYERGGIQLDDKSVVYGATGTDEKQPKQPKQPAEIANAF